MYVQSNGFRLHDLLWVHNTVAIDCGAELFCCFHTPNAGANAHAGLFDILESLHGFTVESICLRLCTQDSRRTVNGRTLAFDL